MAERIKRSKKAEELITEEERMALEDSLSITSEIPAVNPLQGGMSGQVEHISYGRILNKTDIADAASYLKGKNKRRKKK